MMCYHRLMIQWRFTKRVKEQMDAFRNVSYNNDIHNYQYLIYLVYTLQGLSDVVPLHMLKVFDERELEVNE